MKSILMSIQPKLVAKILNGEKTIEIRKRFPKDYRGWVYIYCTKDKKEELNIYDYKNKNNEYWVEIGKYRKHRTSNIERETRPLNGKVVARFYCDNVEEIKLERVNDYSYNTFEYMTETLTENELLKLSCLREYELNNYLTDKSGYTIHISQLEIFDKPKELWEFDSPKGIVPCNKCLLDRFTCKLDHCNSIYKAPQSWCYVEDNL